MMQELRYTLVADGSSDRALIPLLTWLLCENGIETAIKPQWADLSRVHLSERTLRERIVISLNVYPCDLLFVHRDAEKQSPLLRVSEIESALKVALPTAIPPHICVIPVRMLEAWLLFDETAIKHAAGNRNFRPSLNLPKIEQLEQISDPKQELHQRLKDASGLSGRRLKNFNTYHAVVQVSEFIEDFSPLRTLIAFQMLEADIKRFVQNR